MMQGLSDERIQDLKGLTDDYNNLAAHTLQTLDRFVYSIELRRTNKKRSNGDD